jgi:lipoprotein-releasing system ATP-binding protein
VNNALELKKIQHSFVQGGQKLDILRGASLSVAQGEIVALLGPSGCGKTTLLQIAGLLETPKGGEVHIAGKKATAADSVRTMMRRRQIGFVYQFHHLLPDFTAHENLLLPQYVAGVSASLARKRADELLERVGLRLRASHYPSQMSGGEQQRVAIARALVNNPALLLADEPTGNLDPETAEHVFRLMLDTIRAQGTGALIVTHNADLAARMDRVLRVKDGTVN